MGNSVRSLLWLRWQQLVTNKVILFVYVLTPILDLLLTWLMTEMKTDFVLLSFGIGMVYSMTAGAYVSSTVAEEKEKRNMRTLLVAGVQQSEYILTVLFFPGVISLILALSLPFIFGFTIQNWLVYTVIIGLTVVVYLLLNLLIALLSKTQVQTSMYSMLVAMLSMFLPMLSEMNDKVEMLVQFSFIGANTEFFKNSHYQLQSLSFYSLLVWVVLLVILNSLVLLKNRKNS